MIRIETVEEPFTDPNVGRAASVLLGRAETMGFLRDEGVISKLDMPLMTELLRQLGHVGLVQRAIMQGGVASLSQDPDRMVDVLDEANAALENSPIVPQEWPPLRDILGDALLARLCGISEASLRRYASQARPTPDLVAQRLHTLALIVADLRGAYNDYGIRRWFQRPRAQLGRRAPQDVLQSGWTPDSPEVRALRELAAAVSSSPAT